MKFSDYLHPGELAARENGMINFPEAGYTPANLRALLASAGLTQQAAADLLGVTAVSMRRWLMPMDTESHRDMPLFQWLRLLEMAQ